jgi:hypothetical protein
MVAHSTPVGPTGGLTERFCDTFAEESARWFVKELSAGEAPLRLIPRSVVTHLSRTRTKTDGRLNAQCVGPGWILTVRTRSQLVHFLAASFPTDQSGLRFPRCAVARGASCGDPI